MDDKLILAVFKYPELYNVTLPNYRCTESRTNAWRNISMELGLSSEECKRKWKNMRDRYLKEIRMEIKCKRQGEIIQSKWKYRQLMNFIAPFTGSRTGVVDICGHNDDDQDPHDNDLVGVDGESLDREAAKAAQGITKAPVTPPDHKSHMSYGTPISSASQDAQVTQLAALAKMPLGQQMTPGSNAGRKRRSLQEAPSSSHGTGSPSKWPAKDNGAPVPGRPRDEDELFLLSFVPALKRLAPQKRCETKIRIQQVMYEAEFNITQSDELKGESEMPN